MNNLIKDAYQTNDREQKTYEAKRKEVMGHIVVLTAYEIASGMASDYLNLIEDSGCI